MRATFLGGTALLPFLVFAAALCACRAEGALDCRPFVFPCAIEGVD